MHPRPAGIPLDPPFRGSITRDVYLPPGKWFDYQSGKVYDGEGWHSIAAGEIPVILLVRDHTALPHVKVAQHTAAIDWTNVELKIFSSDGANVLGKFSLPSGELKPILLQQAGKSFVVRNDPYHGSVNWSVTRPER